MDTSILQNQLADVFHHASVKTYTLGQSTSIFVKVSMDPREEWINSYYENSRYGTFCLRDGKIELISKGLNVCKFRKTKYKDVEEIVTKLKAWRDKH